MADFSSNSIGDEGAIAISTALESNTSLTELDLSSWDGTQIGTAGAQAIAKMLRVNRSLNSVDLWNNNIPDEGKQQLRDAVQGRTTRLEF